MNTVQGETYKFEEEVMPDNGQVIEVMNPRGTWLEVVFRNVDDTWELVFDEEEDKVAPVEALEFFPTWRVEQLKTMQKEIST